MRFDRSVSSILALAAAGALTSGAARAQVVPVVTGAPITISPSSANVLNLLAPVLGLNAMSVGQATLSTNLSQAIAINNGASPALQALGVSDENLLGNRSNTLRSAPVGGTAATTFGIAANLGGGLPNQAPTAGSTVVPAQAVGGLGVVLGGAYANGINASQVANVGPLSAVATLLNNGYNNLTSPNLGVAKNYFANGAANNAVTYAADQRTVTSATTFPAVAPAGYTLPTANGLPNTTNSFYDIAAGVTNRQAGQDVFGSSRPDQVSTGINSFDPTALNQLAGNPSFPSGHTTYAYTDSILLGMLVPQEYQSMLYRGAAYGNSRIVVGVHYPLDIIGSRALVQYDLAQAFTNPLYINNTNTTGTAVNIPANFNAAAAQVTPYLTAQSITAGCGATIAACAASAANNNGDPYVANAANAATYTANLTYGLPTYTFAQAPREAAPAGGPDASILLAPVYGGDTASAVAISQLGTTVSGTQAVGIAGSLSTATINQIIVNTETTALQAFYGTSLSYWTRIDLAAAAGYFGNVIGSTSLAAADVVNVPVTVNPTGVLSGAGTINGLVTINAGGTLAGGTTAAQAAIQNGAAGVPGLQLKVNGSINFAPGATLGVTASTGQVTSVVATGSATLTGANVAVTQATTGPFNTSKNNLILTAAGGLNGAFAGVTSNLLFATPTLSYDSNTNVFVSLGNPNFAALGGSRNEVAVGNALTSAAASNVNAPIVTALGGFTTAQASQARAVLDGLSGSGLTAAQNVANRSSSEFVSSINDQLVFFGADPGNVNSITLTDDFAARAQGFAPVRELADLPATRTPPAPPSARPRTFRVWATGFGGVEDFGGNAAVGFNGENNSIVGGSAGIDYQLLPGTIVGVAAGGTSGAFNVPAFATSGSTTGAHVAGYSLADFGPYYGASVLSGSFFSNRTNRVVGGFGGVAGEAEAGAFNSREVRLRVESGRRFTGFGGAVTPFVALEIADLSSDGFAEANRNGPTVLGLTSPGQSSADAPAFVGARFERVTALGNGIVLTPTLQVAYVHDFAPQRNQLGSLAGLPQAVFLVDGARPAYNSAQVKAGGELAIGPRSTLFANFDGEFSGAAQFYGGKGGFKYVF